MSPIIPQFSLNQPYLEVSLVINWIVIEIFGKYIEFGFRLLGMNVSLTATNVSSNLQVPVSLNDVYLNLTQGVQIRPCHSHNDYNQKVPLLHALEHGAVSVEADIWAFPDGDYLERTSIATTKLNKRRRQDSVERAKNDKLYVAHTEFDIKEDRTLNLLYLDPLFKLLQESEKLHSDSGFGGIFMESPQQTLYLFLDSKNSPDNIWPLLLSKFKRFRDNNYLTYYDNDKNDWVIRPLTVILTGNQAVDQVDQMPERYFTLDYQLADFLDNSQSSDAAKYSIGTSTDLFKLFQSGWYQVRPFSSGEQTKLKTTIDNAHKNNLITRFWGNTNWLGSLRTSEDNELYKFGSDLLNVDDLSVCLNYAWRK